MADGIVDVVNTAFDSMSAILENHPKIKVAFDAWKLTD